MSKIILTSINLLVETVGFMVRNVLMLVFSIPLCMSAQIIRVDGGQFLEKENPASDKISAPVLQTLRLDHGKVWINGNLIQHQDLPASLRGRITNRDIYASFNGISSVELVFEGKNYLVKPGRICDISKIYESSSSGDSDDKYMERLSKAAPETFQALTREAELNKKCLNLSREYFKVAEPRRKAELKSELRLTLEQLFDLNVENQTKELAFMEQQINIRKEELKLKQAARNKYIARNLTELTELK